MYKHIKTRIIGKDGKVRGETKSHLEGNLMVLDEKCELKKGERVEFFFQIKTTFAVDQDAVFIGAKLPKHYFRKPPKIGGLR